MGTKSNNYKPMEKRTNNSWVNADGYTQSSAAVPNLFAFKAHVSHYI